MKNRRRIRRCLARIESFDDRTLDVSKDVRGERKPSQKQSSSVGRDTEAPMLDEGPSFETQMHASMWTLVISLALS